MTSNPHDIALALTGGATSPLLGRFRYDVAADRWWWSDEVYRMHGFEPGEVVPTTALALAHQHPEDRRAGGCGGAAGLEGSLASVHRIVDAHGDARVVAVLAEVHRDGPGGAALLVTGYFVDVTAMVLGLASGDATRRIRQSDERRAVIDQAVGVVAVHTGEQVGESFALLDAASMHDEAKLRALAERIVTGVAAGGRAYAGPGVGTVEDLLLPRPPEDSHRAGS